MRTEAGCGVEANVSEHEGLFLSLLPRITRRALGPVSLSLYVNMVGNISVLGGSEERCTLSTVPLSRMPWTSRCSAVCHRGHVVWRCAAR